MATATPSYLRRAAAGGVLPTLGVSPKTALMIGVAYLMMIVGVMLTGAPVSALSEEQQGMISQNCGSIQQSLKQLQKTDSRTRVYLGGLYETTLTDFMKPLETRLAKNNLSNENVSQISADFQETRRKFIEDFTTYMKDLEGLGTADCKTDPTGFYSRLETVRWERGQLKESVVKLRSLMNQHIGAVTGILEGMKNG